MRDELFTAFWPGWRCGKSDWDGGKAGADTALADRRIRADFFGPCSIARGSAPLRTEILWHKLLHLDNLFSMLIIGSESDAGGVE
jgi:hypothetical protein